MNNYKNYIYMTICEVSYECCLKTTLVNYQYQKYCTDLRIALDHGYLTKKQEKDIITISCIIEKIYGLSVEDTAVLISGYFHKKNLIEYEKVLRGMDDIFPNYFKYNLHFKK